MTFEKALEAMKQGKKVKPKTDKFAYEIHNGKILLADEYASFIDVTNIPVELLFAEWEIYEPQKKVDPDAFSNLGIETYKDNEYWKHHISFEDLLKLEEDSTMYSTLEITFKSGDTISYNKDEWDDYSYDGKSVCVKKDGAWVGIYNIDHVFSVELKNGE